MKKAIVISLAAVLLGAVLTFGSVRSANADEAVLYTKESFVTATTTKPTTTTTIQCAASITKETFRGTGPSFPETPKG